MKITMRNNSITIMRKVCEDLFPDTPDLEIRFLEISEEERKANDVKPAVLKTENRYHLIIPETELTAYGDMPYIIAEEIAQFVASMRNPNKEADPKEKEKIFDEICIKFTQIMKSIDTEYYNEVLDKETHNG